MQTRWVQSPGSYGLLLALLTVVFAGGFAPASDSAMNYDLKPRPMPGFTSAQKSPTLRFLYRNPSGLRLQATVSQCRDDLNPTRDLTSDILAKQYVDNTNAKLPGFTAKRLGMAGDYRLVWRKGPQRTMLTGIQVKGNTVAVVSLIGTEKGQQDVLAQRRRFVQYLQGAELLPARVLASN